MATIPSWSVLFRLVFSIFLFRDPHNLDQLGMQANELPNFVGGGLVNIDLTTGKIIWQTFFGLTHVCVYVCTYMHIRIY